MDKLVYVETSVPSFYFDTRGSHDMRAMRQWTREWWLLPKFGQELVIGPPVLVELGEAPAAKRDKALGLIEELRILPYTNEITEIVEVISPTSLCRLRRRATPTISRSLASTTATGW